MIITVIPAKGGSKRLPGKNMAILNGKPMIDYSIKSASESKCTDLVYVSTDDDYIANYVQKKGLQVIRRPVSLGGEIPIIEVYRHAIKYINKSNINILVGLQPDHPDRKIKIDEAIEIFREASADRLMSTEKDGTKNGAHYILSDYFIKTGTSRKDVTIIDDCTNIHYIEDLEKAAKNLPL